MVGLHIAQILLGCPWVSEISLEVQKSHTVNRLFSPRKPWCIFPCSAQPSRRRGYKVGQSPQEGDGVMGFTPIGLPTLTHPLLCPHDLE